MKCITVLYPAKDNDGFDHDFYLKRHGPLIKDILGPALHKLEVRKGIPEPGNPPPTYIAVISIWIADWEAYLKAMETRTQELLDEVPLFTKQMPIIQVDEVQFEM
jgi:uncharacterized protein (TIGR02118 family)